MRLNGPLKRRHRKSAELSYRKVRSALTNGSVIVFGSVDHRSAWMRRLRDLVQAHSAQLGNDITEAERRLIARAAMLTIQCEMMDAKWARNDGAASATDLKLYQTAANTLRRLLESLGLQNRPRDITPTLSEYLDGKQMEAAE